MGALARILALASLAAPLAGQTVLFQADFSDPTGWTFTDPQSYPLDAHWDMDNRPNQAPFGSYLSAPWSLNYNNDVNYVGSAIPGECAISPVVDLGQAAGIPQLEFWCNNLSCEGTYTIHERMRVNVVDLGGNLLARERCIWNPYYGQPITCIAGGGWHPHYLVLDRSWGQVHIEFEVRHDGVANDGEGWFFDDLKVVDHPAPVIYCTAKVNSEGCTPRIAVSGTPALTSGFPLVISASEVVNNKVGIFFYGLGGQVAVPFQGGTLCMGPPRRRTPQQSSGGNPPPNDCSGTFAFDFQAWATSGVHPALTAGTQVAGQYWYRDQGAPFDTGLSDAVDFTLLP